MNSNPYNYINPLYSRGSVTYYFFLFGILTGNWVSRIPDLQQKFFLTKGQLGLLLTGGPIGSILIMLIVGKLISKYGSKAILVIGALANHITFAIIYFLPDIYVLWIFLVVSGFGLTITDISMNSQGVEVEKILKTSIMSSLHGFFSIGAFVGAVMGGIFINFKVSPQIHLLAISLMFLPMTIFSVRYLRNERLPPINNKHNKRVSNREIFTDKAILVLGIIAFIAIIGEMMMGDWSLIYLLSYTTTTPSFAALGYAIFALFMTLGRFSGDALLNRMQPKNVIRMFALIGAAGLILSVMTSNVLIIFIGFALLGLGISTIIPIVFKIAGNNKDIEIASGIAAVGFFAYLAGVVEPVFVGQIAELISLKISFIIVALLIGSIILFTNGIKQTSA